MTIAFWFIYIFSVNADGKQSSVAESLGFQHSSYETCVSPYPQRPSVSTTLKLANPNMLESECLEPSI